MNPGDLISILSEIQVNFRHRRFTTVSNVWRQQYLHHGNTTRTLSDPESLHHLHTPVKADLSFLGGPSCLISKDRWR